MRPARAAGLVFLQRNMTDVRQTAQKMAERASYCAVTLQRKERDMDNQWISVSDQMPQEGIRCIIATRVPGRYVIDGEPKDGHEIEFGEWTGDRWKCFSIPCVSIMHPSMVSHWMPMPETPVPRPY